jgi:hypothetical protein
LTSVSVTSSGSFSFTNSFSVSICSITSDSGDSFGRTFSQENIYRLVVHQQWEREVVKFLANAWDHLSRGNRY